MTLLVTYRRIRQKPWFWFSGEVGMQRGTWKDLSRAVRLRPLRERCWVLAQTSRCQLWKEFLEQLWFRLEKQERIRRVVLAQSRKELKWTQKYRYGLIWVLPPAQFDRAVKAWRRQIAAWRKEVLLLVPLEYEDNHRAILQTMFSTGSLLVDCRLTPRSWSDWSWIYQAADETELIAEKDIQQLIQTVQRDSVQLLILLCPHNRCQQRRCCFWWNVLIVREALLKAGIDPVFITPEEYVALYSLE
jgi:hypothetical protein